MSLTNARDRRRQVRMLRHQLALLARLVMRMRASRRPSSATSRTRSKSCSSARTKPSGVAGTVPRSVRLQIGHGSPGAPQWQPWGLSAQGNLGWASHTQPMLSQCRQYFMPIRIIIEASDTSGTLHQAAECVRLKRWLFISRAVLDDASVSWPTRFSGYEKMRALTQTADILTVIS
jgi:hypothetical protein